MGEQSPKTMTARVTSIHAFLPQADYFGLPQTGDYILEATTFDQGSGGAITLTLTEAGAGTPTAGVLVSGEPYSAEPHAGNREHAL